MQKKLTKRIKREQIKIKIHVVILSAKLGNFGRI